jgi:acyl-CoA dehydrogenase
MEMLNFTEDHSDFRERIKAFFQKDVIPYISQWEKEHIVPKSVWKKMGQNGFLCTSLPEKFGAMGGDFLYSVIAAEEITKTNHFGLISFLHSEIVAPYINAYGSDDIREKYLPGAVSGDTILAIAMTEPDAGSDLASLSTTAEEDGDSVVLNGSKIFTSNGINCGLVLVAAKDPAIGNPYKAVSLYLVEEGTPGFVKGNQLQKMGFHSQDTIEIFFSKCRIPKTNTVGKKGMGFYYLMEKLQQERLVCSIAAVAASERVLEETIAFYKQVMLKESLSFRSQTTQFAIVNMQTDVKLGKIFLYSLIADHMAGKEVVMETSMAKYWTTEMARRVADQCMDIYGLRGSLEKHNIERSWRDIRSISIFAGTNEIMRQIIAKKMEL